MIPPTKIIEGKYNYLFALYRVLHCNGELEIFRDTHFRAGFLDISTRARVKHRQKVEKIRDKEEIPVIP